VWRLNRRMFSTAVHSFSVYIIADFSTLIHALGGRSRPGEETTQWRPGKEKLGEALRLKLPQAAKFAPR